MSFSQIGTLLVDFSRNFLQSFCTLATLLTWGFCPYEDYCGVSHPFARCWRKGGITAARHHLPPYSGSLYELTVS